MGAATALVAVGVAARRRRFREPIAPVEAERTRVQSTAKEALALLERANLPEDLAKEVVSQLRRLLLDEERLLSARHEVRAASLADVERERDDLRRQLDAASDPAVRDALQTSLKICESRLTGARERSVAAQRTDAQLQMLAQAASGMRDSLARLQQAPEALGEYGHLRQSVELAHRHSLALEQAAEEVRTLA